MEPGDAAAAYAVLSSLASLGDIERDALVDRVCELETTRIVRFVVGGTAHYALVNKGWAPVTYLTPKMARRYRDVAKGRMPGKAFDRARELDIALQNFGKDIKK